MMRSLYSGVTGLRIHQTRMDVIGNNLANVNTTGFKASKVMFRDVLYQTMSGAGRPSATAPVRGGINPYQIGLGAQVASIDVLNTRAGPQTTDRPLDVYLDGEGYFKVRGPGGGLEDTPSGAIEYYTRVGNFSFDEQGFLVDSNGNYVIGQTEGGLTDIASYSSNIPDTIDPTIDHVGTTIRVDQPDVFMRLSSITVGPDGIITAYDPDATPGDEIVVIGQIALYKFANPDGLSQVGQTYYQPTSNSGVAGEIQAGLAGTGATISNRLEMSNVELAKEFTDMIITQRGFQANSRIITVSDEMLQELVNLKR